VTTDDPALPKERRDMTQHLTWRSTATSWRSALAQRSSLLLSGIRRRQHNRISVALRLDREAPGAHVLWDVVNDGDEPVTVTALVIKQATFERGNAQIIPVSSGQVLPAGGVLVLPTDADWALMSARSVAVRDARGKDHSAGRRQLRRIQERLRTRIVARTAPRAAAVWLAGAANFMLGAVILGLGAFMLLWMIGSSG
jgi:hypothetical protein